MNVFRIAIGTFLMVCGAASAADWARFRGPNGTGIADDKNIPVKWNADNILFKVEIPGKGHSSPIVSKGKIFLQTSSDDLKERYLMCLDAKTGKIIWQKSVPGGPVKTHAKNSPASCTPAADGERVYAIFWDGNDIALTAWDYDGNLKWTQPLGSFTSQHGPGMSPMLVGNTVVVNNDQDGKADLLTFDAKTGKPGWSKKRNPNRACYSTPFLLEKTDAGPDMIVCSTGGVTAYDPKDGTEIWNFAWKFDNPKMPLRTVASPIFHQGMIFAVSGDGNGARHMVVLKAGGQGDVSNSNLVWELKKGTAYVPSLLAKDGLLFWVDDKVNVVICADAKTGNIKWSERLGGDSVSSSPVMIDGKIYLFTEKGTAFVFPATDRFDQLGRMEMGEQVYATPAVADGKLYVRGFKHLFCIGNK